MLAIHIDLKDSNCSQYELLCAEFNSLYVLPLDAIEFANWIQMP